MENTFENALKYVRHLDSIEHTWSESEKTLATAMLSYAAKTSQKSDCISNVSDCFSFAKYLSKHFEYSDNTKGGDTYTDRDGATYSEADIYDEWVNNR